MKEQIKKAVQALLETPEAREALSIVLANSHGGIWLGGSAVYGTTIGKQPKDYDFIVENKNEEIIVPRGWEAEVNSYGNPKFKKGDIRVDFIPLASVHSIRRRNLPARPEHYLSGTPFDVQSILYDVITQRIIGKGLEAIANQAVRINNYEEAQHYAQLKGKNVIELLKEKAKKLGFTAVYI